MFLRLLTASACNDVGAYSVSSTTVSQITPPTLVETELLIEEDEESMDCSDSRLIDPQYNEQQIECFYMYCTCQSLTRIDGFGLT